MTSVERFLEAQTVEGEIGLVIDYQAGKVLAVDVLQAAMGMIQALDRLDAILLSSVNTSLEPVSVLNDVQHSSLKMLLARALRNVPDELIGNLDWKKWAGGLLVKGKYKLLQQIDADAPEILHALQELKNDYKAAPGLIGFDAPSVTDVIGALDGVAKARSALPGQLVKIQTELGDVFIPEAPVPTAVVEGSFEPTQTVTNGGVEFFKVKAPDMLGAAQWSVLRNGRTVKVDMLHASWVLAYHRREHPIMPGDSLKCRYEETISYDALGNEVERHLAIIEVLEVISPPIQRGLDLEV